MRVMKHIAPVAAAALLAIGAAACTAGPDADDRSVMQSDPAITTSIQSRYFADTTVKGIAIDVDTREGVVTLSGTVDSALERDRAVAIAQDTDGVLRVEDRLVVEPADTAPPEAMADAGDSVDATWVTTKIEAKYFVDPDVKGRDIDVTTSENGTVTLRGRVDTADAKRQAVTIANETDGVRQVVDQLVVAPDDVDVTVADAGEEISDGWITMKIQAQYFLDPDIKGRNIDVTTANRIVTLAGMVESPSERREALSIARSTDGVTEVNDQLRVVPPADAETDPGDEPITDAWLTTKIQAQYFVDPDVSSMAIDVTTENRVVTLTGQVESATEKTLAETIAAETSGVERVVNRLVVQNGNPAGDR